VAAAAWPSLADPVDELELMRAEKDAGIDVVDAPRGDPSPDDGRTRFSRCEPGRRRVSE